MNLNPGDRLGDYEVIHSLGAGGMGQVYKVQNVITRRVEAMKVLLPDLVGATAAIERFIREIQLLAGLLHPNIATLYTAQIFDNQLVMIMEFVDGITLFDKLQNQQTTLGEGLSYVAQTLTALEFAHSRGVIHRDIKPANLMITHDGIVKVMDFGIAKVAGERSLTRTGTTLGSLFYMSPEQALGKTSELNGRSDLYSVGVVLYEIVTGKRPFECDSDYSMMAAHINTPPVPPVHLVPGLPPELNRAVLKAMAKDPNQRFQTAREFLLALEVLTNPPAAEQKRSAFILNTPGSPTGLDPNNSKQANAAHLGALRRHRALYIALGSVLAIAALAVVATVVPQFSRTKAGSNGATAKGSVTSPAESVPPVQPPGATPNIASAPPIEVDQKAHAVDTPSTIREETGRTNQPTEARHTPNRLDTDSHAHSAGANATRPVSSSPSTIDNAASGESAVAPERPPAAEPTAEELRAKAYVLTGQDKMKAQDYVSAKGNFQMALNLDPNNAAAKKGLAAAKKALGE
jgi:eukaryotic-like serine/threonine-protein kinase